MHRRNSVSKEEKVIGAEGKQLTHLGTWKQFRGPQSIPILLLLSTLFWGPCVSQPLVFLHSSPALPCAFGNDLQFPWPGLRCSLRTWLLLSFCLFLVLDTLDNLHDRPSLPLGTTGPVLNRDNQTDANQDMKGWAVGLCPPVQVLSLVS